MSQPGAPPEPVVQRCPARRAILERDQEQLAEQPLDPGITGARSVSPGRGVGQQVIVPTMDRIGVEHAGLAGTESHRLAGADRIGVEVECRIEHQYQPVVEAGRRRGPLVGEGERGARLGRLHRLVVGGGEELAIVGRTTRLQSGGDTQGKFLGQTPGSNPAHEPRAGVAPIRLSVRFACLQVRGVQKKNAALLSGVHIN